jgi:hypothetical protein
MTMLHKLAMFAIVVMALVAIQRFSAANGNAPPPPPGAAPGRQGRAPATSNAPRTLAPYFTQATPPPKAPNAEGFLQRWLLLEPINQAIRTNAIFTDSYVRNAIQTQNFPAQFTAVPRHGDKVTIAGEQLAWHALDATDFNVKLFRFAYGLNKPTYGVLYFAVTVVNSPQEMPTVRMAVGSNSASRWWLNGKDAVDLFGDRRMVMDDAVSKRLTLKKGSNIIHGAVINGPGMSDFCVRFIDENGEPVKGLTLNLEGAGN